jgi:hypothetical protein
MGASCQTVRDRQVQPSRTSLSVNTRTIDRLLAPFFGVGRKQVIDGCVGRRYQNRFGVRK